jgi:PilZ domain.
MYYLGKHVSGTGSAHDVSLAGWRVIGDHHVTIGDTLSLRIFLPTVSDPVQIDSATVQWVKGREFGLHMGTLPLSIQNAIKAFMHTIAEPTHLDD